MALGKSSIKSNTKTPIIHYAEDSIFSPTHRKEESNVNNDKSILNPLDVLNPLNPVSVYNL